MNIYERLSMLCSEKGTRPYTALQECGISPSLATELKMGRVKSISAKTAKKIADYFGVSVNYILYGDETSPDAAKIPVYGEIAAGLPIIAEQNIIDYEEIPAQLAKSGEYYALQVRGDSMQPRMMTGDIVIVRKSEVFESGQISVVGVNGDEATLKKVLVRPNGVTLISLNPAYPPINYSAQQVEELPVRCMGIAVEVRGKLNW